MTDTLIRGRVLFFNRRPESRDDLAACSYQEDGAVLVRDGMIVQAGDHDQVSQMAGVDAVVIDHRPHLILPGFIDAHVHMPQMQVIASYGTELLDWLNTYTFPEESKFRDAQHGRRIARLFLDESIRHGTTTVAAYCSVHKASAEAFFAEAQGRNMMVIAGKVMMDRNAPDAVLDTAQASYDDTKALIESWHKRGRQRYAITPRFALTSTPEQLEAAGALAREYPDCHVQTHLSENNAEIAETMALYPGQQDYTAIYEHYGLTGPKSLFGHCIHLSEREADALSESGSVAVFCPTSNLFLGSGLFAYHRYSKREKPLCVAVASDVGGGTNYSLLRTMDEAYKVIALQGEKLNPLLSFWQITRGNAEALSISDKVGTLDAGTDADLVVLDASATPTMALRMETVRSLAEELFLLQTLGDDRAVREVYVAGKAVKGDMQSDPTTG
ncbi:guanine deaminase [Tianweitania sp. BSSL-BM11]|uniref:Guanine deaminase n=1 Tax=Tianweitania aestuarii TaxID=2814886 RepID=A0ABS5S3I2_9HYPH|nr:guanine deaminase [Tianweitania aestuarii]MBS9722487.1 guanine deaminase [Tianweitania aestuarii]